MTLFTDATKIRQKTLPCYDNLASSRCPFPSGAFCYTIFGIKAQFIIRTEELMVLACWASYNKQMLAQQVIPLALGYQTALSSHLLVSQFNSHWTKFFLPFSGYSVA